MMHDGLWHPSELADSGRGNHDEIASTESMQLMALHSAVEALLTCEDKDAAFQLLDSICERIIELDAAGLPQMLSTVKPGLYEKVAELDSYAEQRAALKALSLDLDTLDHYPWLLADYYTAERSSIERIIPGPIQSVTIVGHGAVPHSAMLFRDKELRLVDIDPQVSELAQRMMERFAPETSFRRLVANIENLVSRRSDFVLEEDEDHLSASCNGCHIALIANAAFPPLLSRDAPLDYDYVVIRSATERGSLLYPRFSNEDIESAGYRVLAREPDSLYDIHELIVCQPGRTRGQVQ